VDPDTDIVPDVAAAREFVVDEWGVDASEVETGFERIEEASTQTGLGRFT
jgi:flap endonuclease 1 (EC 3.1.-.-)